jgi:hypothetical protein
MLDGASDLEATRFHRLLVVQLDDCGSAAVERHPDDDLQPWLLRLAIVSWQRVHGHIGLELAGVHAAMGISSDALYRTEVDAIIAEATERN